MAESPDISEGVSNLFGISQAKPTEAPEKVASPFGIEKEDTTTDIFGEKDNKVPFHKNPEFKKVTAEREAAREEAKQMKEKLEKVQETLGVFSKHYSNFPDPKAALFQDYRLGETAFALKDRPETIAFMNLVDAFAKQNPSLQGSQTMTPNDEKPTTTDPRLETLLRENVANKLDNWLKDSHIAPKYHSLIQDYALTHIDPTGLTKTELVKAVDDMCTKYGWSVEDITGKAPKSKTTPPVAGIRNPSPATGKRTSEEGDVKEAPKSFKEAKAELSRKAAALFSGPST